MRRDLALFVMLELLDCRRKLKSMIVIVLGYTCLSQLKVEACLTCLKCTPPVLLIINSARRWKTQNSDSAKFLINILMQGTDSHETFAISNVLMMTLRTISRHKYPSKAFPVPITTFVIAILWKWQVKQTCSICKTRSIPRSLSQLRSWKIG